MVSHNVKPVSRALAALGVVSVVCSEAAAAHVRFVTNAEQAGEGLAFLADALTDPVNAVVLGGGGLATLGALVVYLRVRPLQRDIAVFRDVMTGYRDLLAWLLRLGFGLPLVGAGFAGYFFTPIVDPTVAPGLVRLFQIGLGFALLFGIATRVAAIVGLLVYLLALVSQPLLLYSFEWVPGLAAIALIGSGRPSADEVLQKVAAAEGTVYGRIDPVHRAASWLNRLTDPYERLVPTVIRVGMGLSFAFLGLFEKLLAPEMALSVVEQYDLTALAPFPAELWVLGAGFAELGLGLAILFGFFTRISAITALSVFVLTLFGIPDDPVLAHIGLFSLASALLITGAGAYALDNRIGADKPAATHDGIVPP
ncbi:DoxX family protein [Halopenitus persicus]|uniref:DoxX family protein n=1 Tax=Halopenitus persicus TaxID=1048396 RepID=UPI000BBACD19|nr:DoxX family protein [Halopenitus persicus]